MAVIETGEEFVTRRAILKKENRTGTYHLTEVRGDGYWVTVCGRVFRESRVEMVFTPGTLCQLCKSLGSK